MTKLLFSHEVQYIVSRFDGGRYMSDGFDALIQSDSIWIMYKDPGDFEIVAGTDDRNQFHSTYTVVILQSHEWKYIQQKRKGDDWWQWIAQGWVLYQKSLVKIEV